MASPICILEAGSYLRHNKETGTASCSVSLEVVMTLHLSLERRGFVSYLPSKQGEFSQSSKGSWEGERDSRFPLCQLLPTFWVLLLWQEKCSVWQLVGCRYAGETYSSSLPASSLKQVCCKGAFVVFQGIDKNLWLSNPQGNTFTYQRCRLWRNAADPPGQWTNILKWCRVEQHTTSSLLRAPHIDLEEEEDNSMMTCYVEHLIGILLAARLYASYFNLIRQS